MPFSNLLNAGAELIQAALQSVGFTSGQKGWQITRDGAAEFASLTARGDLLIPSVGLNDTHNPSTLSVASILSRLTMLSWFRQAGFPRQSQNSFIQRLSANYTTTIDPTMILGDQIGFPTRPYGAPEVPLIALVYVSLDVAWANGSAPPTGDFLARCRIDLDGGGFGTVLDGAAAFRNAGTTNLRQPVSFFWAFPYSPPEAAAGQSFVPLNIDAYHNAGTNGYLVRSSQTRVMVLLIPDFWTQ